MYTATLSEFKIKQDELFRQAEKFRLIKSVEKTENRLSKIVRDFGEKIDQLISQ